MPGFDSVEALNILNKSDVKIPFLLISDGITGDIASSLIENGAKATISKRKMENLVPAVVKELQHVLASKNDRDSTGKVNSKSEAQPTSNGSSISLFEAKKLPDEINPNKGTKGNSSSKNGDSIDEESGDDSSPIKNILIVEDEMIQSILLEKLIKSLGYKVVGKVTTGADAIEMALKLKPDVITMDISLQDDIDGIMATKSIQDKSMIPVIYISGNSDQYNYERAETTNFIDFIPKPVNKETLAKSFSKAENIKIKKSS
jgi:CheY-like chemotaxis protein